MRLDELIKVKRRYTRSVNLERDLEKADSVDGYILTPKISSIIDRFLQAFLTPNSVRAWTITGVYGTGKSALAHFIASLCDKKNENVNLSAQRILKSYDKSFTKAIDQMPDNGLVKAVITSQREPIAVTLIRGLHRGVNTYYKGKRGVKPKVLTEINSIYKKIDKDGNVNNKIVLGLINEVAKSTKTGLLIIVDELGKSLEYAAQHQIMSDLYLLQQIAELPSDKYNPRIFFIGFLHQSFSDYAHSLTASQRNEWAKIQGRFEDIPFTESPERLLYLISSSFEYTTNNYQPYLNKWARKWKTPLSKNKLFEKNTLKELSSIYPLHPISAVTLPLLCNRFAQNDRTLFSFIASEEPHSFASFLRKNSIIDESLPTFKIHKLYDYFIESAGINMSLHPQNQKWVEIQERISDANNLNLKSIQVLKTIGILNLISTTGSLRASKLLVSLSMCDSISNHGDVSLWESTINDLIKKGFITWRKKLDELRIWEGSDFDIDKEVQDQIQQIRAPLADLLNEFYPLKPLIARRHSYETGTIRYFERRYIDTLSSITNNVKTDCDGLIYYLINKNDPSEKIPKHTSDKKPIIIVQGVELKFLQLACNEYVAHKNIKTHSKEIQSDGVARKELRQRLFLSKKVLDEALQVSFDFNSNKVNSWIDRRKVKFKSEKSFNVKLSNKCDEVYSKGPNIWNELINRSELTSQGTKARREIYEAMINNQGKERLGLKGYGPECTIFESLLKESGIYSYIDGNWLFTVPKKTSGVYYSWEAIEDFCKQASHSPVSVDKLYENLYRPPYGVRQGILPILFLSVLMHHSDYISVYFDGTYIPILTPPHIELLTKRPDKFAVKYFEISGLHAKVFKELEEIILNPGLSKSKNLRNVTLLGVVNPLVKIISKLPPYSLNTDKISAEAKAVRKAILQAREPDKLLFIELPQALNIPLIDVNSSVDSSIIHSFRKKIIIAIQELQSSYDNLIDKSQKLLFNAFAVRSERANLREDLRVRANHLKGQVIEPVLKRFIIAATNTDFDSRQWLESTLMVIADKPVNSWSDTDVDLFETKLSDIARRFMNLESILRDLVRVGGAGFDARKVSVTFPDGEEINEVVWIDHNKQEQINNIVERILNDESLLENEKIKRAVVASIIEKVFPKQDKELYLIHDLKGKRKRA